MAAVVSTEDRYGLLLEAAACPTRVSSLTHGFYRYPARFGEGFVRQAIESFSRRGDTVVDPFCGGGTTVVEALALGRRVVACDINALGLLVSRVKTTPLHSRQKKAVELWASDASSSVVSLLSSHIDSNDALLIGVPATHRNLLANLRGTLQRLPVGETRDFARVAVLKTIQWALDGKELLPTPKQIVARLEDSVQDMLSGVKLLEEAVKTLGLSKEDFQEGRRLFRCAAEELRNKPFFPGKPSANLVVTSPPYLGVHVLYNKWQVAGRVETRAPYFLAEVPDLGAPSNYTLVSRKARSEAAHERYYAAIGHSFSAVSDRLSDKGFVIQLVSFADADAALPRYLKAMDSASLEICDVYVSSVGGLSWRRVPGRRWYARVGAVRDSSAANEVLLVHRKRR